jgi:hypothetical protein
LKKIKKRRITVEEDQEKRITVEEDQEKRITVEENHFFFERMCILMI